jgi:hypothetical protein
MVMARIERPQIEQAAGGGWFDVGAVIVEGHDRETGRFRGPALPKPPSY